MARQNYPSDNVDKLLLRFPKGLRDKLKEAADANGRSMNAEAVARLEASFALESEMTAPIGGSSVHAFAAAAKRALDRESSTQLALKDLADEVAKLRMKIIDVRVSPEGNEFTITRASPDQPNYAPFPDPPVAETDHDKLEALKGIAARLGYEMVKKEK